MYFYVCRQLLSEKRVRFFHTYLLFTGGKCSPERSTKNSVQDSDQSSEINLRFFNYSQHLFVTHKERVEPGLE